MASKKKNKNAGLANRIAADNRKARHLYSIEAEYEAGLVLTGTEIKSLRAGQCNIAESYAEVRGGEVWLVNANITEFSHGNIFNHQPRRPRKLLLHKREISRLHGAVQRDGITLVPMRIYFTAKGRAKIMLGLGKGKKLHDKRQDAKLRDWNRQKARVMKEHG